MTRQQGGGGVYSNDITGQSLLIETVKNTIFVIDEDAAFQKNTQQFASPCYCFDLNMNTA